MKADSRNRFFGQMSDRLRRFLTLFGIAALLLSFFSAHFAERQDIRLVKIEIISSDLTSLMDMRHNNNIVISILWYNFLATPGIQLGVMPKEMSHKEKEVAGLEALFAYETISDIVTLIDHDALLKINKSVCEVNKLMARRLWIMNESLYPTGKKSELEQYIARIDTIHTNLAIELTKVSGWDAKELSRKSNSDLVDLNREIAGNALTLKAKVLQDYNKAQNTEKFYRYFGYFLLAMGSVALFLSEFIDFQSNIRSRRITALYLMGGLALGISFWAGEMVGHFEDISKKLFSVATKMSAYSSSNAFYVMLEESYQTLMSRRHLDIPTDEEKDLVVRLVERINSMRELMIDINILFSQDYKNFEKKDKIIRSVGKATQEFLDETGRSSNLLEDNSLSAKAKTAKLESTIITANDTIEQFKNSIPELISYSDSKKNFFELVYYFCYILGTALLLIPALFIVTGQSRK